jgi:hypothetical protein
LADLTTNLNQSPYFDSFNTDDQYYRVLFKPTFAVQTREINSIQSTFQNQISQMGQNIFVNGTIVEGCNITHKNNLAYVKINDNYANGAALTISDLNGLYALSNTGLKAYIRSSLQGYISQSPNLNTLFVTYLNSATSNAAIKVFQNDEIISIVTTQNNVIGQVQIANTISSGNSNTTGLSYLVSVGNGTIFQKGTMLEVDKQEIIVSTYSNQPNNISVGFQSVETIVTSFQDQSLLDNSQGSPNYAAPGADRLKIVPTLTLRQSNSISSNDFFSIVDFVGGSPSIVNGNTVYSTIGDKMAQYSYETNGNFVINPFNVRTLVNYTSTGIVDPFNIKLEIDAGLAYIQGYRVQILGKLLGVLPKGNTIKNAPSQIITTQLGNYLQVDEFAGFFNPAIIQQVSLRNAPAYAVSNNLSKGIPANSISAPGSEIGKANILAVEYDNGIQGLNSCVYDIYLFNIQMNSGQNFSSVLSLYANNSGQLGFADVVLSSNTFSLQDSTLGTMVYPFNQAAIATLKNSANTIDTQFQFIQSANVNFSNSGTVTVTLPTYTGGTNELPFGTGTLTTPQKENFIIISEGNAISSNIAGTISTSGNVVTGFSTAFTTSLYQGCFINIANSTVSEIKQVSSIANNTSLTLTQNATNTWSAANVAIQFMAGMNIPMSLGNTSISVGSSTTFSVSLNQNLSSSLNASILYPIQRVVASPAKKQLQTSVFVKINLSNTVNGIKGPWSLGIPDVYAISNVWYGASYSNTNPSITNQFHLNTNQTDQYYGLSYLTSNGASLSNTNYLLVQCQAYQRDTSAGAGFFSVDSYPVDDTGVAANSIYTYDIQTYTSQANGTTFNLRNSADFRLYVQNTIPYISNVSLAISNTSIVNPSNVISFSTSNLFIPVNGAEFESSLQYYVGRYDVVGLSPQGTIVINSGTPSENPAPAGDIQSGMTLATIYVPPYPTLTVDVDIPPSSNGNAVSSLVYNTNRRYTMRDIGVLDQKIQQATYYSALSVLEQSAQNLLLTNESGTTVFQNGVLADPFNDFSISNTLDPEFNIAIDGSASELRPTFTQFLVNLQYANNLSNNISQSNDGLLLTLSQTQTGPWITQPFASQLRNCAEDILYNWVGNVSLNPSGDYFPDVTVNPAVVVDLDSYSNWVNLANAWGTQWGTWNETGSTTSSSTSSKKSFGATTTTTTSSTANTYSQTGTTLSVTPVNSTYSFGDVVTDISLQPFCKSNLIKFYATGLKPSTQVWTFFNDTPISQYCVQTDLNYNILNQTGMFTDATGTIYGYFYLPANTFYTGSINFQIMDISSLVTESNIITTIATCAYQGTNLSYTTNNLELQTQTAQIALTTVSQSMVTYSNSTSSNTVISNPPAAVSDFITGHNGAPGTGASGGVGAGPGGGDGDGDGGDPIAQAFSIFGTIVPQNVQGVYIDSIDIFFSQTDPNLGITIMIRDMDNGYPGVNIVPGSEIHILPSQITTSTNASIPTNIVFPEPIFLESGTDYCFVLSPDGSNPNYDLWTGVISGTDVLTGSPIYSLSFIGDMFLSSQNSTWTGYQNESIKFNIYRANFTAASGIATFTNDDTDYLSVYNTSRVFSLGERVYYSNNILQSGNISVSNVSTTVTGNTSGLSSNAKIYLFSNTNNSTMIANVNSVTTGSFVINTVPVFTDNNCSIGILSSNGGLTGIIKSVNSTIIAVGNSTANSTVYLSTNNGIIIGSQSLASAAIANLNDIPYDTIMPKFATSVPSVTALNFTMLGTSNSSTSYVKDSNIINLTFGQSIDLIDEERVVMSKSNEMKYNSGNKSLFVYGNMSTSSTYLSPAINMVKSGMVCVQNLVNGDDANNDVLISEITNSGNAINKYVSRTVTLLTGMEAESLTVYIGAYYPPNTSIYVYTKLQNQYDSDPFNNKAWTPLVTTNITRSSKINNQDFNQYIYNLPNALPSGNAYLNTAYLNANNSGIVRYTSNSGVIFDTFATFAVKIVLLSNAGSQLVPRLTDLVCVCTAA